MSRGLLVKEVYGQKWKCHNSIKMSYVLLLKLLINGIMTLLLVVFVLQFIVISYVKYNL